MFKHYLLITFRNIRKYALQNLVSVIGLVAGFVCLCLSSVWLRYEKSFDRFHKDADRICTLYGELGQGLSQHMMPMGNLAITSFTDAMGITEKTFLRFNEDAEEYIEIQVDSAFCNFFNIGLVRGDWSFIGDRNAVAVSDEYAKRVFPDTDPLEQTIDGRTIKAVVDGFNRPTVLKFDVMSYRPVEYNIDAQDLSSFSSYGEITKHNQSICFFKLPDGVDLKSVLADSDDPVINLNKAELTALGGNIDVEPIIELHERMISGSSYVSYRVMSLFSLASALLMICSLVNILIFFINLIIIRERESKLRIVHGASARSLFRMFTIEVAVLVLIGFLLGLLAVWILKKPFIGLTDAGMPSGYLMKICLFETLAVFAVSLLFCMGGIRAMISNPLQHSVNGNRFRKFSVGLQLFVGTLFIFVICVMLKQFAFLRNENWGLKVNDQATVSMADENMPDFMNMNFQDEAEWDRFSEMMNTNFQEKVEQLYGMTGKLKALPMVTDVIGGTGDLYSTRNHIITYSIGNINGIDSVKYGLTDVLDENVQKILNLTVLDGAIPEDRQILENEIVITQNLSRQLGLGPVNSDPTISIECSIMDEFFSYHTETVSFHVIAVVRDICLYSFTDDPENMIFCTPCNPKLASSRGLLSELMAYNALFLIHYRHGCKKELKQTLDDLFEGMNIDYEISFTEDKYFESLEKEMHLMNLIVGLAAVCMLISVFGIWSMMSLACQERRREIAVRKAHGAKVRDILLIFVRDYGKMVLVSVLLAFATGFLIAHNWLQQYPRQTVISWWIYLGIFAVMILVITLTVGNMVLKTARENPYEVIKSE